MEYNMKLAAIPAAEYDDYRLNAIFSAYKWDPQVHDHNTVSHHALLLGDKTAQEIGEMAETLARETVAMEAALLQNPTLAKDLGLPGRIRKTLGGVKGYNSADHVRLMRFDFHPTPTGWMISEVNSDVPGGFAEASLLPKLAKPYFPGSRLGPHAGQHLLRAFQKRVPEGQHIGFVHATSYSDDRQVMQFLGDYFTENGYPADYLAPDHVTWVNGRAHSNLHGNDGPLGGIVRFFPLEWLETLPRSARPQGFYSGTTTACNHPAAMYTQSKRLPLVWDKLGVDIPAWKSLLPETRSPKQIHISDETYVLKPALGRVGEGISIPGAVSEKELKKIRKQAGRNHRHWVAQRRFESQPLLDESGTPRHLCLGVFVIDGRFAGLYGRVSPFPRIDDRARDIPVLIQEDL